MLPAIRAMAALLPVLALTALLAGCNDHDELQSRVLVGRIAPSLRAQTPRLEETLDRYRGEALVPAEPVASGRLRAAALVDALGKWALENGEPFRQESDTLRTRADVNQLKIETIKVIRNGVELTGTTRVKVIGRNHGEQRWRVENLVLAEPAGSDGNLEALLDALQAAGFVSAGGLPVGTGFWREEIAMLPAGKRQ